ncbi:START domain-containing protein [Fulvivirgaceae bacterium BMA12]|uniref:START domain-containing protein n=1 Tax=Agaribacillus aureus TaxID=3051825 RepID=A0ABT8L7B6_9BACT|nr:START domain-containing protein [Fulvivirgaceae bacterium BMA12]
MKTGIALFIITFLWFDTYPGKDNASTWELKKDKNGIQIYARNAPGWEYQELKVTMQLESSLSGLVAALKDVPSYPEWVYTCTDAYFYKNSPHEEYYYTKFKAPWPVKSRDLIVHSVIEQDSITKTVIFKGKGLPQYRPMSDGIVRIPAFDGKYLLVPKGADMVDVTYIVKLDPGGWLPPWLVNLVSTSGPYNSFVKLRDFVKRDKYQKASLAYIDELQ